MDPAILNGRLRTREDENIHQKQNSEVRGQSHIASLNERIESLVTGGISDVPCHSEIFGEQKSPAMSNRNAEDNTTVAIQPDVIAKKTRQQKEMTFQDMYNQEMEYDDVDEDDDSDWEPLEKNVPTMKWFCINCTMMNFDDVVHCDVCGEHKESDIVGRENSTSHLTWGPHAQGTSGVIDGCEESFTREPVLTSCTAVGFDERMLLHSENEMKSQPHPERPDRLRAIVASLANAGIFPGRCIPIPAREITQEELVMVHSLEHVEAVELTSCMLSSYFTPDTYANEHSACAARIAAGLCADLSKTIMSGQAKNGFALVRPPGHHAGVRQAMGFCLHNNAAVAALVAQSANAKKVLIVDWDVHHGNGTQEIFEGSKSVLYISLHRHDGGRFYPGTGAADEVGTKDAEGYCVNIPWKRGGVGDNDYIFAFQYIVLPIALDFGPDLTIISAGFDAARGDPLGCCDVTPAGFAQMTNMLTDLSDGKLLVILEGGYNLRSISSSATAVINVLLGKIADYDMDGVVPSKSGLVTVLEVMKIQMKYWPNLESSFTKLQSQWASFSFRSKRIRDRLLHSLSREAKLIRDHISTLGDTHISGCRSTNAFEESFSNLVDNTHVHAIQNLTEEMCNKDSVAMSPNSNHTMVHSGSLISEVGAIETLTSLGSSQIEANPSQQFNIQLPKFNLSLFDAYAKKVKKRKHDLRSAMKAKRLRKKVGNLISKDVEKLVEVSQENLRQPREQELIAHEQLKECEKLCPLPEVLEMETSIAIDKGRMSSFVGEEDLRTMPFTSHPHLELIRGQRAIAIADSVKNPVVATTLAKSNILPKDWDATLNLSREDLFGQACSSFFMGLGHLVQMASKFSICEESEKEAKAKLIITKGDLEKLREERVQTNKLKAQLKASTKKVEDLEKEINLIKCEMQFQHHLELEALKSEHLKEKLEMATKHRQELNNLHDQFQAKLELSILQREREIQHAYEQRLKELVEDGDEFERDDNYTEEGNMAEGFISNLQKTPLETSPIEEEQIPASLRQGVGIGDHDRARMNTPIMQSDVE